MELYLRTAAKRTVPKHCIPVLPPTRKNTVQSVPRADKANSVRSAEAKAGPPYRSGLYC